MYRRDPLKGAGAAIGAAALLAAALLPRATVKIYEGAPHGLFLTHMERLNKVLQEFVAT